MISFKKIVLTLISLIFCLVLLSNFRKKDSINPSIVEHFQLSKNIFSVMTTKEDFIQWLNKEEKAIWDDLSKILNISLEKFETLKKEKRSEYIASIDSMIKSYGSGEAISQKTEQCIKDIMNTAGVNPSEVTIVAWSYDKDHIKSYGEKSGPPCHPESLLRLELGNKIAGILNNTEIIKIV